MEKEYPLKIKEMLMAQIIRSCSNEWLIQATPDFNEGINNVLVCKENNPKWNPSTINDINFEEVKKFFNPHIEPLNLEWLWKNNFLPLQKLS